MSGMDFDSTHEHGYEEADLGRLFLPEIAPEEAVNWPSDATDLFTWEDDDRDYDPGVYEASLIDSLDMQDSLLADYGPTHDTYTDWEE